MINLADAAYATVARLENEVAELRAEETKEVVACAKAKSPIGEHYWQNRHNAEERLRAARALAEALHE